MPNSVAGFVKNALAQFLSARQEREEWRRFGARQLARAYGPDEPEYTEFDAL
jgi:hypothetical protein